MEWVYGISSFVECPVEKNHFFETVLWCILGCLSLLSTEISTLLKIFVHFENELLALSVIVTHLLHKHFFVRGIRCEYFFTLCGLSFSWYSLLKSSVNCENYLGICTYYPSVKFFSIKLFIRSSCIFNHNIHLSSDNHEELVPESFLATKMCSCSSFYKTAQY
jgi:hypothetical protein